ncbi:MAG TPA: hypothetical protein VH761_06835 [Ilumatobacteraceae bacterium]
MSVLDADDRKQLITLLGRVLDKANDVDAEPLEPLAGIRHRPSRLV